ncbi:MAG: erythromycin esterase family protein [Bacteroidales bacterium]|nr:erythromycin esterase family protein [Bacteroidales bacterium]MDP2234898.1 erythromycin esterase family protein [Bacteroidales bacterium]
MKKIILLILLLNSLTFIWGQDQELTKDSSLFSKNLTKKPKVKDAWKDYVIKNSIPLRSIRSDDFSDLNFLRELLKDKKYVFLGESSHVVEEFSVLKYRLIRFLTKEMDFSAVVFESDIWDCYQLNLQKERATSKEILEQTIYPAWHTSSVEELLLFIMEHDIEFAGFDIKPSALRYQYYFEKNLLAQTDTALANLTFSCSKKFLSTYYSHAQNSNEKQLDQILFDHQNLYRLLRSTPLPFTDSLTLKVFLREIENRMHIIKELTKMDFNEILASRDSLMAETIEWLIKEVYPDKKIIFWGANGHISKNNSIDGVSTGALLNQSILDESFVIGLYMFRGETYTDRVIKVHKPKKNSLEAIMIQPGYKYAFIDFSKANQTESSSWIFQKIPSLYWGKKREMIIPRKTYDGVILIDKASLPDHYLLDYKSN